MYQKLICHHSVALRWLDSVHLGGIHRQLVLSVTPCWIPVARYHYVAANKAVKSNPLDSIGCASRPLRAPPCDTTSQLHFQNAARWHWQRAGVTTMTRTSSIRKFTHIWHDDVPFPFYGFPQKKSMRVVVMMLWFCTSMMNLSSSDVSTGLWNASDLLVSVCPQSGSLFCPSL